MFAVIRHPDLDTVGLTPESGLEFFRVKGWYRVSEYRPNPADFHLPDFADATEDLDAPEPATEPEPEPESAAADTKESKA